MSTYQTLAKSEEKRRLRALSDLYVLMLKHHARVLEVEEIRPNYYNVHVEYGYGCNRSPAWFILQPMII